MSPSTPRRELLFTGTTRAARVARRSEHGDLAGFFARANVVNFSRPLVTASCAGAGGVFVVLSQSQRRLIHKHLPSVDKNVQ